MNDLIRNGIYSSTDILAAIERGDIFISDFDVARLQPNSYDVILGNWFYEVIWTNGEPEYIGPSYYDDNTPVPVPVGGTLLAMTKDIIGTIGRVFAQMQAQSSRGRMGLMVCKCAGLGDIGYRNPWTMELSALVSKGQPFVTPGETIAQLVFSEAISAPVTPYQGQYNVDDWPLCMVPAKWRHRVRMVR